MFLSVQLQSISRKCNIPLTLRLNKSDKNYGTRTGTTPTSQLLYIHSFIHSDTQKNPHNSQDTKGSSLLVIV